MVTGTLTYSRGCLEVTSKVLEKRELTAKYILDLLLFG
jgi:hypothetical protein